MGTVDKLTNIIQTRFGGNQAAFARAIKRSPSQVNQWLSGYRRMDVKVCRLIERALDLPPDSLFEDKYQVATAIVMPAKMDVPEYRPDIQSDSAEISEIVAIARQLDDVGIGMLLREARVIARERGKTQQREAV